jgi:N-ethylmaleimide reductase
MTSASAATLFTPLRLGAFALSHRVVMPAMARHRAAAGGIPTEAMAHFYGRRSTAGGMIICEACAVSPQAARPHALGLHTTEQVNHWQKVTRAVHDRGGIVLAQLDHGSCWTRDEASADTALDDEALASALLDYRNAAENAGDAGFDGVELHAAHGALPARMLAVEMRAQHSTAGRFIGTVTGTLANVWGSERVGVCLSPSSSAPDCGDDWIDDYAETVRKLRGQAVAFVHVVDASAPGPRASTSLRAASPDGMLVSGGFTRDEAVVSIADGNADAIGFGRAFVANADLVDRLQRGAALDAVDAEA